MISSNFFRRCFATSLSKLTIRNSQNCQLRLNLQYGEQKQNNISIQFPKSSSLEELQQLIKEKADLKNIQFKCEDGFDLPKITPIQVLLNQNFQVRSDNHPPINIYGQFSGSNVISGFNQTEKQTNYLRLSAITMKDQQKYLQRVRQLVDLKFKKTLDDNEQIQISKQQAKRVLIEALISPQPVQRTAYMLENVWIEQYNEMKNLNKLKKQAEQICHKRVNRRLLFICFLSFLNVLAIWSGTYYFYTWDIMQPVAYFIDAFSAIVVSLYFFRMGRICNHYNYRKYIFDKLIPKVYKDVGFNVTQYNVKEVKLRTIEAAIKDHFINRL